MSEFNTKIANIDQSAETAGKPSRKASLADVARQAGVSTATVSRVLNNPEKVAEKKPPAGGRRRQCVGLYPGWCSACARLEALGDRRSGGTHTGQRIIRLRDTEAFSAGCVSSATP